MSILQVIGAVIQIFFMWYKTKIEKDSKLRKKQEKALKEANDALANKDSSALNASIQRFGRL